MDRYEIYCTTGQTKKALELGAPIRTIKSIRTKDTILSDDVIEFDENTFTYATTPTAEQIIGWLEEQGVVNIDTFRVTESFYGLSWYGYKISFPWRKEQFNEIEYDSRKEATLAAIDAALEYLTKNKRELCRV